jgi:hypothetical protein
VKRVVTHKQPDGDALAALYLAEQFLFPGEIVEIVFVSRGAATEGAGAVVDVGNEYDPERLRFDHKPPAFTDRNEHCATSLLWNYLRECGAAVGHLAEFVAVVHEGDTNPPRSPSDALKRSRSNGYHATVARARRETTTDAECYAAVRAWLEEHLPADLRAPGSGRGK